MISNLILYVVHLKFLQIKFYVIAHFPVGVLIGCDAPSGGQWSEKHANIFQNSDLVFSY